MRHHRWVKGTVAVSGLLLLQVLQAAGAGAVRAEEGTWQAEVVDPASYLKDGRHGPEMEAETSEAVNGGQTLALLDTTTNTLYLLLAEEPGEDPNELVYDDLNQVVKVHGVLYEHGGLRGIVVTSVEPLAPPAQPTAANQSVPATN